MRIEKNMDVQNDLLQNKDKLLASIERKVEKKSGIPNPRNMTINGSNIRTNNIVSDRQSYARKQAFKVVSDAFNGEKKLDAQMQSILDEISRFHRYIGEENADIKANNDILKGFQEEYAVEPDSKENQELELYAKRIVRTLRDLSEEERDNLTEYQKKALGYFVNNEKSRKNIEEYQQKLEGYVIGYKDMKIERLKSQDMVDAQEAAEDIMETSNGETIALLTQEAVEHVDEEQEEREEKAKEAQEKKKEEKKEEAKKLEEEAIQQELIESIREQASESQRTSADVKRAIARRERADAESMDAEAVSKTIISDKSSLEETQDAVNMEITNILNRLSLLSSDVKGSVIDDQL